MKHLRAGRLLAVAVMTVAGLSLVAPSAAAHSAAANASGIRRACAASTSPKIAACMVLIRTGIRPKTERFFAGKAPVGFGYGPAEVASAYGLTSMKTVRKVAVVDAYNDPKAATDLAIYRSSSGLPACKASTKAGCLTVTNEFGATSKLPKNAGSTGWAIQESQDVDVVAGICPSCHIFLVEASSPSIANLGTSVDSAIKVLGAKYVVNSTAPWRAAPRPAMTPGTTSTLAWPSPRLREMTATASPTRPPRSGSRRSAAPP